MYRSTQSSQATEWSYNISDETLLDLAAKGSMPKKRLRAYVKEGRIKIDKLLAALKFGPYENGDKVLKHYYPELFL